MERRHQKRELLLTFAVMLVYVVGMRVADAVSVQRGDSVSLGVAFAVILALALLFWARGSGRMTQLGLCRGRGEKPLLRYWPLLILVSCNFWLGVRSVELTVPVLYYMLGMFLIGFLEEFIFRGLLFCALRGRSLRLAIAVSSLSFGIGHIVNLFNGSGMMLLANLCQVLYATACGYLFVMIFCRDGTLLPAILTHGAINAMSVFAKEPETLLQQILPAFLLTMLAVCLALLLEKDVKNSR